MNINKLYFAFLILLSGCILFSGCKKNPAACLTVSTETPAFGETLQIDGGCSSETKWIDFFVDGEKIAGGVNSATYICLNPGQHTISMKAYSKWKGAPFRAVCTECYGAGEVSESSKVITTSATIAAQSNSPLYYDQTLQLSTGNIEGASFSWTGPNNFTADQQNPEINNVNATAAGVYTVKATANTGAIASGTVNVILLPVTPPCSTANNQCIFTGGLSTTTITNIYHAYTAGGYFELHANSNSLQMYIRFKGAIIPAEGVYTLTGEYYDMAANEAYMEIQPNGFLDNPTGYPGKVYISVNAGKVTASFCSIPFSYNSYFFTITGKVVQP